MTDFRLTETHHIVGLTGPGTVGAVRSQGETLWTLTLTFVAWRTDDGPVRPEPLVVLVPVEQQLIGQAQKRFPPFCIVRIQGGSELSVLDSRIQTSWSALKVVADDPELAAIGKSLQTPVRHTEPNICELTLNRELGIFEGVMSWCGLTLNLFVESDGDSPHPQSIQNLRRIWPDLAQWQDRAVRKLADDIIAQAQEFVALDDPEATITREQLAARQRLDTITFGSSDRPEMFCFTFEDDRMTLGDHGLAVACTLERGPEQTEWI